MSNANLNQNQGSNAPILHRTGSDSFDILDMSGFNYDPMAGDMSKSELYDFFQVCRVRFKSLSSCQLSSMNIGCIRDVISILLWTILLVQGSTSITKHPLPIFGRSIWTGVRFYFLCVRNNVCAFSSVLGIHFIDKAPWNVYQLMSASQHTAVCLFPSAIKWQDNWNTLKSCAVFLDTLKW